VTPLHMAAACGHTATVKALLLAAGVDVNIQRKVCTSPHPAPTSRIVSAVGAGVLRRGESPRRRPSGVTRLPSLLADDVSWVGWGVQDGWTPLHLAAQYGHMAVVEVLLAAGAELNAREEVRYPSSPPLTLPPCLPRMRVCAETG
jgi:ankyrin repeat protein